MNIKEYQAKNFFKKHSVPVLDSQVVDSPQSAFESAEKLGGKVFAVKAQVLAGGRGKGGGIKIVRGPEEVRQAAQTLLQSRLVTPPNLSGRGVGFSGLD